MRKLQFGIDVFLARQLSQLKGQRVALLSNHASISGTLDSTLLLLSRHKGLSLCKLFAPEHGFFGTAQDMETVHHEKEAQTGLPIISLYGSTIDTLKPRAKDLQDVDILICDLQDVGCRYYTFIYTICLCMETCAKLGKKVIVLDRPNPLDGVTIEGNLPDPAFASFVGLYQLPNRHGMTLGELALYINKTQNLGCDLKVVCMQGWQRHGLWEQTQHSFVPPSPNMPSPRTALVYPGMCLIEATEVSEGRGTTKPFEWIGAPYIDAHQLAKNMNAHALQGIAFKPIHFIPQFQKWAKQECRGVSLFVTNAKTFRPYRTGLVLIKAIHDLYPGAFAWRDKPYEFVSDKAAIDLLTGNTEYRERVEQGRSLTPYFKKMEKDEKAFAQMRKPFLLYR